MTRFFIAGGVAVTWMAIALFFAERDRRAVVRRDLTSSRRYADACRALHQDLSIVREPAGHGQPLLRPLPESAGSRTTDTRSLAHREPGRHRQSFVGGLTPAGAGHPHASQRRTT